MYDLEDFQSFYDTPRTTEGLEHLNSVHKCYEQCHNLERFPLYRGYEIIVGNGCYCLMDYDIYDEDFGGAMIGEGRGRGSITGSNENTGGHYCYAFKRHVDLGANGNEVQVGSGPMPARPAVSETTYDPIHLLVGKGQCHDKYGRRYASLFHSTSDGSNRSCRNICNLVTPVQFYRGYENYPHEKKCACLFDSSTATDHNAKYTIHVDAGTGGAGNVWGSKEIHSGGKKRDAYCYRYYKVVKKTKDADGRVDVKDVENTNSVEFGDENNLDGMEEYASMATQAVSQVGEEETSTKVSVPSQKHKSIGKGLCGDSESRIYIGITYQNPEQSTGVVTKLDCEVICHQYADSPFYRGYEIHTSVGCKCLFDAAAKEDSILAVSLENFGSAGKGEVVSLVAPNNMHECFKYTGDEDDKSGGHNDHNKFTWGVRAYELVGEGICVDKNGGWFDAVEFKNVDATDCESKCEIFTDHPQYRGIEVTLGKVCFCLFDDGTKLDDANVLNYGKGKGDIVGVQKKEGLSGPFCFRLTRVKSDDAKAFSSDNDDDPIMNSRTLHGRGSDKAAAPASQPSSVGKGDSTKDALSEPLTKPPPHTYDSVFVPHQTQYDFLRFDPYSFSGAPLGGWGRDTRNRLASLPIRLVHGFEEWNGVKSNSDKEVKAPEDGNAGPGGVKINPDGSQIAQDNAMDLNNVKTQTSSSQPPHFVIHDGTGQKYVCRVYYDDELVVVSRMDSMFLPATTVEENGGSAVTFEPPTDSTALTGTKSGAKNSFNLKIQGDGKSTVQLLSKSFNIDVNAEGDTLADAISTAVANTLNNLGLEDVVATIDGQNANGEAENMNALLTQIGMQAAVGAGINGASQVAASTGMGSQSSNRKLALGEILKALDTLKGICSQIHLGWWSYEWCHDEDVKQFHVGVSSTGAMNQNQLSYEVQDVTLVGHFNGAMEIIYPAGNYATAEDSQGTTITMLRGSDGKIIDTDIRVHTKDEANEWKLSHHNNEVLRRYHKNSSFDNRGPIIKLTFDHGDMCDEIGYPRQMSVEMRCCTDDEMLRFMKSKTQVSSAKTSLTKKDMPKAALVGVEESKRDICHYTSQVCTPVLCPDQNQVAVSSKQPKAAITTESFQNEDIQNELANALETAGGAIVSRLAEMLGEILDPDDVQVYVTDEGNAGLIEDLLNDGTHPGELKGLLNQFFAKNGVTKRPPALQMRDGESVRELLSRSLDQKPW